MEGPYRPTGPGERESYATGGTRLEHEETPMPGHASTKLKANDSPNKPLDEFRRHNIGEWDK